MEITETQRISAFIMNFLIKVRSDVRNTTQNACSCLFHDLWALFMRCMSVLHEVSMNDHLLLRRKKAIQLSGCLSFMNLIICLEIPMHEFSSSQILHSEAFECKQSVAHTSICFMKVRKTVLSVTSPAR